MSLLVLAFPVFEQNDFSLVQSWRGKNDPLYSIVAPHFTLVFNVDGFDETEFLEEIECRADGIPQIEFEFDKAIVHKDELGNGFYQFLVPAKGYNEITALHDQLYSKKLKPYLRDDIAYIPHLTVGQSSDEETSLEIVANINSQKILIPGLIESIAILAYSGKIVTKKKEIVLAV